MKITRLETLRLAEFPNLVWVRVHTDGALAGVGETSFAAQSVEAYLHEFVAPRVLGRDPLEIGFRHRALGPVRQGLQPAPLPGARRREPGRDPHL
jgi:L-alanine-DL-glutamate epimerase-like enolase superfamily enzyme